jgi:hypothetical protein
VGSVADDILAALQPMLYADAAHGNALSIYVSSMGDVLLQDIEDYASDTNDGEIGWSLLVDINRAPDIALPWLAQFVGVQLVGGLSAANQRQQIRDLGNLGRGTVAAMRGAPAPFLTGSKTVIFRERYNAAAPGADAPYYLQVITYLSETPDAVSVLAALMAQKPAGIVLTYSINSGQDYTSLRTAYATYAAAKTAYATYEGMRSATPGI